VAAQYEPNTYEEKMKSKGETHGVNLEQFDVAAGGEHSTTPPPMKKRMEMPPTLATKI
jgi:hypothetical protein